jgi:hypothetical protein
MNIKIHEHISSYVDSLRREYISDDFIYASYNAPNTTYKFANDLDHIMLSLSHPAIKVWFRTMTLLKRNSDPVLACSIQLKLEYFTDIMSRATYFKAVAELVARDLLIKTPKRSLYIINIKYANKLYNPKVVVPVEVAETLPPPPPK